ncbi:MAG: ATP-binding cassette domain-containing protein [Desulfobacterales bacterium]|nr:ATP-binding cassette domain-containing protein [Desulfobacterales bacterium]
MRPQFRMIFQDSVSALNSRRKIGESAAVPLKIMGVGNRARRKRLVLDMLESVGVDSEACDRLPFEFSGGQCQRIQIARALMTRPKLLVRDEPVSSLDVSVQARIINLLEYPRKRLDLTMLFISHDLAVVKNVRDLVAVMHLGKHREILAVRKTASLSSPSLHRGASFRHSGPDPARAGGETPVRRNAVADGPALGRRVACHFPGER